MYHKTILAVLSVIATLTGVKCGLVDIFNISSDYNLASALDIAFALTRNDIGLVLSGEITTPIEEDVTFWCGNRYVEFAITFRWKCLKNFPIVENLQGCLKRSSMIQKCSRRSISRNRFTSRQN